MLVVGEWASPRNDPEHRVGARHLHRHVETLRVGRYVNYLNAEELVQAMLWLRVWPNCASGN